MEIQKLENKELGLNLNAFYSKKKDERVFIAQQMMNQLGYKGGNQTLRYYNLIEGDNKVTLRKKDYPDFFKQLNDINVIGLRTSTVIMLYESGVWKLIMQSKKPIGIKTRNWLASEVLPSIREKGYYDVSESIDNPLSYLHDFTEPKKQISNSKEGAVKVNHEEYHKIYNEIHLLVTDKTAKEIKEIFKTKESAHQALREHLPHYASTEAVIDELYTKYNKSLEEIEETGAHKTLPPAFQSLYKLGIKF